MTPEQAKLRLLEAPRAPCSGRLGTLIDAAATGLEIYQALNHAPERSEADGPDRSIPEGEDSMKHTTNGRRGRVAASGTLKDDVATVVKDLTAMVGDRLDAARSQTSAIVHRAKESAGAAHERRGEFAGSRPLTTIAVSAAAGIALFKLAGWLRHRRSCEDE